MKYYNNVVLRDDFKSVSERTEASLQKEGFGILSRIDIKDTLKKKLNVDFKNYLILGACNPPFAFEALKAEEKIGTMLPCNVVIIEKDDGMVEVAAIDPLISMEAVANKDLFKIAVKINHKLKNVIKNL